MATCKKLMFCTHCCYTIATNLHPSDERELVEQGYIWDKCRHCKKHRKFQAINFSIRRNNENP